MRPSIQQYRSMENFYWEHCSESSSNHIEFFCLAFAHIVGDSDDPESLQQAAVENFEQILYSAVGEDDELNQKDLKKAFKSFDMMKVIDTINDFSYLLGLYELCKNDFSYKGSA